jgi:mitogen-activated protein kinase kinase kinase
MATGAPPWSDCSTQVQIIFKIASSSEIPTIPEHLSPEGQDFLRLCLQRDAEQRPEAVSLLEEEFVLDAHRSNEQQSIPGLQYDAWTSSMHDEEVSVRSSDAGSRVNSSRRVVWGELE